ncbi:MAG: FAD-dependent oxidoreductase [Marmoricola sp.]
MSTTLFVLSPGARPVRPPIPGIERALTLRDIEDTDAIVKAVADAKTVTVIGGGFIGVEMAENLRHLGLEVTLVEATSQLMAPLDPELASLVHERVRAHEVDLRLGVAVTSIGADTVTISDGTEAPAEVVIAAIGVRPDTSLAERAGLKIGPRGGVFVDDSLRTSDPHIYAVGDAVEKLDGIDGSQALVPLANTANRQGRLVADIIAGRSVHNPGVLGTAIVGVFGLQVAATGWNEKRLRAAHRPYVAIHTHPGSHAGYYPGADTMHLKLLAEPDTWQILGAQGVGESGVDKRIDVIATAMRGGLTAADLATLELAYAPAFGSAKDPINMLGWIADNLSTGATQSIQWHELDDALSQGATLVDVRSPGEHAAGAIPGAVNIELDHLRSRLHELPEGNLVVHCQVGIRGHIAARILAEHGRSVRNLDGGYLHLVGGNLTQLGTRWRTPSRLGQKRP